MKVIFLPSKDDLTKTEKKLIRRVLLGHARLAAKALKYNPLLLTFTVYPAWKRTDRGGMPAFTQSPEWIWIALHPKLFRKKPAEMFERLKYLAYHEMHHAARGYTGFLSGKKEHTLMNCYISEGLADHFALEQYPSEYVKKLVKYNAKEVKKWLRKIKGEEWSNDYKSSMVMGGNGKPARLGYKIGRYLIDNVKKNNPRFTARRSVRVDSKKLLKMGGIH